MMNTRCTKLSVVRDDSKSSKTSNKKCPVVLHGDHMLVGLGIFIVNRLCRAVAKQLLWKSSVEVSRRKPIRE